MTLAISERARAMPPSPIRKLAPLAEQARRRGVRVYHLNIGQPDLETPPSMRDRLKQWSEPVFAYTSAGGTPEYLATLRDYYRGLGLAIDLEHLLATTGASEALLFAFMACAEAGDDILVVEPFYPNYASFAAMAGVRLVPITARAEDGFHLPARSAWERARTPRTRAVVLCNPNNPSGTVYTREELEDVGRFCRDHGLFLIADEVYREFAYDGRQAASALTLEESTESVLVVDSLSKRYSACGIRLGCLVTRNPQVHDACHRMAQGRLSPPGLAQVAAVGVRALGPEYVQETVAQYQRRREVLYEGLQSIPGVLVPRPEGAFYLMARLPVRDGEDFARWLLTDFEHEGGTVMVAPAAGFYSTPGLGSNEVRLAYVLNTQDLRVAADLLGRGLARYLTVRDPGHAPGPPPDFVLDPVAGPGLR